MESSCFAVVKAKEKSCGNSFDCSGITCLDINWILCKALVEIWRYILSCGKRICAVIRNIRRVEHTLIFNIFNPNHLWSPRRRWRDLQRLLNPLSLKMQSTQGNNKSPFILKMVFFSCSAPEITGPWGEWADIQQVTEAGNGKPKFAEDCGRTAKCSGLCGRQQFKDSENGKRKPKT